LEKQFDELFTRKIKWASLDLALKRIHDNYTELLLVLDIYKKLAIHLDTPATGYPPTESGVVFAFLHVRPRP